MEEVYNFIRNEIDLSPGDAIVVGVSGGPDSMALLYILNEFKIKMDLKLICAHINHSKRKESDEEEAYVKKYCKDNNIIFECIKITKWGDDNFENEARSVRYNFFEELIYNYDAKYLMTAHHADDLIETILMRIVRGSTLKGYSGFSKIVEKDGYKIVRPLITLTKDEILEFDRLNNIKYYIDSTNNENIHTRNRYRHTILPFLKKENPNVHKKFLKFSETLIENSNYIDNEANKVFNKVFQNGLLYIDKLLELDKVIQTKIIYNILEKIYGDDLLIIGDVHVDLIFDLINSNKSNSIVHLPNSVIIIKAYNELSFSYDEETYDEYEIEISDIVNLPDGRIIEKVNESIDTSNNTIRLHSKSLKLPLYVRNRRDGDRMEVKGLNGSKKISDIFIDKKIKANERDIWPVVLDSENNIIWLPGLKKSKYDRKSTEEYDIILRYY
ncbi:MAG: tRNA lysidine(34) synthetase TilS [Bacilli bacterium]|nr:tRNA lysidine(34) synthetase TilS [Bacilli bacterium]